MIPLLSAVEELRSRAAAALLGRKFLETDQEVLAALAELTDSGLQALWQKGLVAEGQGEQFAKSLDQEWRELQERQQLLKNRKEELQEMRIGLTRQKKRVEILSKPLENILPNSQMVAEVLAIKRRKLTMIIKQLEFLPGEIAGKIDEAARRDPESKMDGLLEEQSQLEKEIEAIEKYAAELTKLEGLTQRFDQDTASLELEENDLQEKQEDFAIRKNNFQRLAADYDFAIKLQAELDEDARRASIAKAERLTGDGASKDGTGAAAAPLVTEVLKIEEGYFDEEIPEGFTCPITQEIMHDPVMIVETGQSYEREKIERWLSEHRTDPATGKELTSTLFAPNIALKMIWLPIILIYNLFLKNGIC